MMITRLSEVWPLLERAAREEGVVRLGASDLIDRHAEMFEEWIDRGHHASMAYLAKNREVRLDPRRRFPWARSIVVMLVPYASERPQAPAGALSHHVARYALGDDYHQVLDRMLRRFEEEIGRLAPEAKTWRYVDTGPLSDRAAAAQAGLGWIGRNGMLIDETNGSYLFIGTLLTSLENDIDAALVADRCGTCTRCVDACPTSAILPNRTVASGECISYATIEHRGALPENVSTHLEGNAFGCDICQEVCPWNHAPAAAHPAFRARDEYRATPVTDLLKYEQAAFSRLFRRSAVKRAKLAGMRRNVSALTGSAEVEGSPDQSGVD
ncbi:MAG TPA: tRNA epoxyqueuosine(34) reductase QueG [Thermoanaerobaculia bacterium]|nr:tRNA epoxyqueuosine(34) reductase QueG [Thermoanaerobaculia bacterium]